MFHNFHTGNVECNVAAKNVMTNSWTFYQQTIYTSWAKETKNCTQCGQLRLMTIHAMMKYCYWFSVHFMTPTHLLRSCSMIIHCQQSRTCVCVEHLNRWKTSNPLAMVWNFDPWIFRFWTLSQQGGSESHSIHCPMKTVVWDCDIGTDHPDVPAISNFQFFVNGYRLSPEPACRIPKTGFKTKCDSCLYGFRNLIYCWLRQVEQLHLART